jgi:hypothetical protein
MLVVAVLLSCKHNTSMVSANAGPQGITSKSKAIRFAINDGEVRQRIEVWERDDGTIDVSISVQQPCVRQVQGIAQPAADEGDLDIEIDAFGEGHPVDTFFLGESNNCIIRIRLAVGDRSNVWLKEWGCSTECPLNLMPMIRQ